MASLVKCIDIAVPATDVWALLEDVRRLPEFSPSTEAVTDAPDRVTARGQTFTQTVRKLGRCFRSRWRVTDIDPGRMLAIEGSIGLGATYRLTEEVAAMSATTSRLRLTVDYQLPFGLLGRLAARAGVERLAAGEASQVVEGLKALLEREADGSAHPNVRSVPAGATPSAGRT
jgi:carbon monoxide dehydrogenase subunit G